MDQSIERALTSLIPAHNGPLPSKLVALATSLLAQSRTRASNLKAEEEIARAYACANLACERLKQALNLPKIDSRPPCPPRVYKKLYKYLEHVLPAGHRSRPLRSSPPTTAGVPLSNSSKAQPESTLTKSQIGSNSSKPHSAGLNSVKTRSKPSPAVIAKTNNVKQVGNLEQESSSGSYLGSEAPVWVQPLLDHLCTHVFRPQAASYVLQGLRAVLTLPPPNEPHSSKETRNTPDKIAALLIALCIFVSTRLSGVPLNVDTLNAHRKRALAVLDLPEFANTSMEKIQRKDIDDCMWTLSEEGWIGLEWFKDIPLGNDPALLAREISGAVEGSDVSDDTDVDDVTEIASREISSSLSSQKVTPLGGLGTMVQSKVDYLSEEKRAEYLEWRERIGKRVAEIETARGKSTTTSNSRSSTASIGVSMGIGIASD